MSECFRVCKKIIEKKLEYNADSVEWCPIERSKNILLCGTYQLKESNTIIEKNRERVGKLYAFEYTKNAENENRNTSSDSLKILKEYETAGLLDIKWSCHELCGRTSYATANALGELTVWNEKEESDTLCYSVVGKAVVADDKELLALSLDWDNAVKSSEEPQIAVSYSDGGLAIARFNGEAIDMVRSWKAHDFEAWICAFNYYNTNLVYSGGDDCKLKGWDLRTDCSYSTFTSKQHEMGVCSIQQNFLYETIVATGSYDERVLFWDQRNMKEPLKRTCVGGGVWRIKWEPHEAMQVAVATMYNGFHVIDCADVCGKVPCTEKETVSSYKEHESLAYGVDWFKDPMGHGEPGSAKNGKLLASCSFYDNLLTLWTLYN